LWPEENVVVDALQINCALWAMLICGEIKVVEWVNLLF